MKTEPNYFEYFSFNKLGELPALTKIKKIF